MNELIQNKQPDLQALPNITFRQLEVFCVTCHERSYTNAALELKSTRANIKRTCDDFSSAVGRKLFDESADRTLEPTEFAHGLLAQVTPLSRALRRLGEGVRLQHEGGRILRFGAAGEFFRGGLFSHFLARLKITDVFRPCYLRIESKRHRNALLNAECDVYFGAGLKASDRMELVDLGTIPWKILKGAAHPGKLPTTPADLTGPDWAIALAGDPEKAVEMMAAFHAAGAVGGKIVDEEAAQTPKDGLLFLPDITAAQNGATPSEWPEYRFCAVLRKHHPYSELMARLQAAALS